MKHKKLTKLKLSAYTVKRHTPPCGGEVTIHLPHEMACDWANKIVPVLHNIKSQIESEYPTQVTQSTASPEQNTTTTQSTQYNGNTTH